MAEKGTGTKSLKGKGSAGKKICSCGSTMELLPSGFYRCPQCDTEVRAT